LFKYNNLELSTSSIKNISFLFYRITILFFIGTIFFSWNLWFNPNRIIPFVSIVDLELTPYINILGSILLLLSLGYNFFSFNKINLGFSLCIIIILCLFDRIKCQPWLYFYFVILLFYFIEGITKRFNYIITAKYLLSIMYIWAGVHKLTSQFLTSMSFIFKEDYETVRPFFSWFPFLEILIGFLFFSFAHKKRMNLLGVAFHISIMLFIVYTNTNFIILIWNTYFITIYLLHYLSSTKISEYEFPDWKTFVICFLFAFLPVLSYTKSFDQYFSFSLYSGKTPQFFLVFPRSEFSESLKDSFNEAILSETVAKDVLNIQSSEVVISYHKLSLSTLKVPLVAEKDVILFLENHYSSLYPGCKMVIFNY